MRVRKLSRLLLILVAAVIALIFVLLIGANLYVQSHGAQAKIQQELSQRLGTTLRIQQVSVTPWGGLKLTGITVPQDRAGVESNFLEAETFRLRLKLSALFAKRLVIRDVSLISPKIVWPQGDNGNWRLPGERASREMPAPVATATEASPPAETSAASPPANVPVPSPLTSSPVGRPAIEKIKLDFEPEVRRVNVTDGDFRFLDRAGGTAANFEGVNFRSVLDSATALHGQARIARVNLRNRFYLSDVQTPVRYDPAELALAKISAHAANGDLFGQFSMHPQSADAPFNLSVHFRNLQADQVVTEAGGPSGMVQGILEGKFDAEGKTSDAESLAGSGEIFLRDGQLRQYSLLAALGQVLQIEELTQLRLEQAEAKYRVSPGVVTIDQLILRSPNIRLSATGTVGFNGKLRLEAQLALNEKIRNQLFRPVRQNFQPIDEPGYAAVDFQVTGTLDRPKSNLVEKVVGRDIKDLGSMINSFLGGSKSDKAKKRKGAAAPTPNETPVESAPVASATPLATP